MAEYVIEYKSADYPYNYRFAKYKGTDEIAVFKGIREARQSAMALIRRGNAVLCAIRGKGIEQLVYQFKDVDGFALEDRKTGKWYKLNWDGSLWFERKDVAFMHTVIRKSAY